ncbi:hypothetical protein [Niallia sp. 03133]|uniref:hypothetical protein n=1 Tax=Niallia sp. 03133 TaxID=3458060 RepID=UPI004044975C
MGSLNVFIQKNLEKSGSNLCFYEIGIDKGGVDLYNKFLVDMIKNLNPPTIYIIFSEMESNLQIVKGNLKSLGLNKLLILEKDNTFIIEPNNLGKLSYIIKDLLDSVMIGLSAYIILGGNPELEKCLLEQKVDIKNLDDIISLSTTLLVVHEQGLSLITKGKSLVNTKDVIEIIPLDVKIDYLNTDS